jgi:rod shape-determining protein MreC
VLVLALVSIAMMTIDHRQQHMENVRQVLSYVVYPIQYLVSLPSATGDWWGESFSTRRVLEEENRTLKARQLLLETQLLKLEALEAENHRLRNLLDSSADLKQPVLIAELVSVDMAPFSRQIVLNKGSRHNVHEGQPILDASGVMGQIVRVSAMTSTAMLITDPSHAIPVEVNRSGLRAIAQGTGESHRLELSHLPRNADIEEGDLLVTSGLGGRFPPGYPVARVTEIARQPDSPFALVSAEPLAQLESTRVVLLVVEAADPLAEDKSVTDPSPNGDRQAED